MKVSAINFGSINKNNANFCANRGSKNTFSTRYSLDDKDTEVLCIRGKANNFFKAEKDFDTRKIISNAKCGANAIVTPKNEKYKNLRILISKDSKIVSNEDSYQDFSISIEKTSPVGGQPSFGMLYCSIRKNGDGSSDAKMKSEYLKFYISGMKTLAETKDRHPYSDSIKDTYNHYTPTDGDGTRFKPVSVLQGGVTKPASHLPATYNGAKVSFIQAVLTNFARTGTMDEKVRFLEVEPARGSAYAFLEGLKQGAISTEKPIVFSWGDNFTDINISRIIRKHEKSGSGFTMLVLPREKERVSALGVIKVEDNQSIPLKDRKIEMFVEKPTDKKFIDSLILDELSNDGDEKALAVVGPYIISREALRWLKKEYTNNPQKFKNDKGYDFSSTVITGLLDAMKKGEICDRKTGKPMSMYFDIKKDNESWSDVGSRNDFVDAVKSVRDGGFRKLPEEIKSSIKRNIDKNNNIYISEKARKLANEMEKELDITLSDCIICTAN